MARQPIPVDQANAAARPRPAPRPAGAKLGGGIQEVRGARATGVREEMEEREELGALGVWSQEALRNTPSWLVSMIFHMIVLLVLALWMLPTDLGNELRQLVIAPALKEDPPDDREDWDDDIDDDIDLGETAVEFASVESPVEREDMNISAAEDVETAAISVELAEFGLTRAPRSDLLATMGGLKGTGLSGRGPGSRSKWVREGGGNKHSEAAVARALKWLAMHQCADGGWNFDMRMCPGCLGKCSHSGESGEARIAATSMALLPFLGAGQTHTEGKYKTQVNNGVRFLCRNMKIDRQGASLWEPAGSGNMYSHGLAAIALCENYAMTHDKHLHAPAQGAINFICSAQDPVGGGWRYKPRERGDTSVVGWQIMALKSGHMAYLRVPPQVVKKAFGYLDTVQSDSGAAYGYRGPGSGKATTAIGLLCRMYLGWKKENPALIRGVQQISDWGPSPNDLYYNYYATQVCRHWGGDIWEKWNGQMRDQLINSQAKVGHEDGSWYFSDGHKTAKGGRLYCTALATMILEVYYRHLPIYRPQAAEEAFPVE